MSWVRVVRIESTGQGYMMSLLMSLALGVLSGHFRVRIPVAGIYGDFLR